MEFREAPPAAAGGIAPSPWPARPSGLRKNPAGAPNTRAPRPPLGVRRGRQVLMVSTALPDGRGCARQTDSAPGASRPTCPSPSAGKASSIAKTCHAQLFPKEFRPKSSKARRTTVIPFAGRLPNVAHRLAGSCKGERVVFRPAEAEGGAGWYPVRPHRPASRGSRSTPQCGRFAAGRARRRSR